MSTIRAQAHSSKPAQKQAALRGGAHLVGSVSTPHVSTPTSPKSPDNAGDSKSEHAGSAFDSSAPVVSSFDDPDDPAPSRLGYKDELEVRFIWDRVLGKGRHGTTTRVVIDRFSGVEYACKRMPKHAPADLLPDNATAEQRSEANDLQLRHIRREITLFSKLRSSLNVARLEQVYEDSTHVYLVMEKCSGPSLAEVTVDGDADEQSVRNYMRSVVRTIVQCHDEDEPHAAVEPGKFMLLSEDRQSTVKATGFGRLDSGKGTYRAGKSAHADPSCGAAIQVPPPDAPSLDTPADITSPCRRRQVPGEHRQYGTRDAGQRSSTDWQECRHLGCWAHGNQAAHRVLPVR